MKGYQWRSYYIWHKTPSNTKTLYDIFSVVWIVTCCWWCCHVLVISRGLPCNITQLMSCVHGSHSRFENKDPKCHNSIASNWMRSQGCWTLLINEVMLCIWLYLCQLFLSNHLHNSLALQFGWFIVYETTLNIAYIVPYGNRPITKTN